MHPINYTYPERPKNVQEDLLKPSAEFRKEAWGVVRSIITFMITFVLLILAAAGLALACAYAGFWIVTTIHNLWAIVFGIGLTGFGIMVLYFLFKFVFKTNRVDRSHMMEITAKDHPLVFDFIRRLARETQTARPKRVYLSPDVNACVFYDSSFWSMFFPVRKNLNIGLGLVNSLNVSELKAVIAHEFGHFSQRSMKLGSFTYHVNRIIHDMLYDNRDYERTLESWGNVSNVFAFFATLTSVVVEVIKQILQKLYTYINERYMALSRQMEFHADAVAASVSGSSPLAAALYRFDVSSTCYENVLTYYNSWIAENKKGLNVYEHHALLMNTCANQYGLKMEHGLLQIDSAAHKKLRKSKVQVSDQWASHPDTVEREKKLNELSLPSDVVTDPAWTLFTDPEKLQREVTARLYQTVEFQPNVQIIDANAFASILRERTEKFGLNKAFKGFYDGRDITVFNPDTALRQDTVPAGNLSAILTDEVLGLPSRIEGLTIDIEVLEQIQDKSSPVKSFDLDGTKYSRSAAKELVGKLKEELKHASSALEKADRDIFLLYHKRRPLNGDSSFGEYFLHQQKTAEEVKLLASMIRETATLFNRQDLSQDAWIAITNNMHRGGDIIKGKMKSFLSDQGNIEYYSGEEKEILERFIADNRKYFFNVGCDSEAINLHLQALHIYLQMIEAKSFQQKKRILDSLAMELV